MNNKVQYNNSGINRVNIALSVTGDTETAQRVRKQIEHYAQSLPNVKVG